MKGERTLEKVLLALIAAATIVTAVSVREIARNGFSIELTAEEAQKVVEAYEQAVKDMDGE